MSLSELNQPDTDRRTRILEGATDVFLAYGFQRTTMDDIARAAEISRPALYLQFRNKSDIYRALAENFLKETISHAEDALRGDGPLGDRIFGALDCAMCQMAEIERSPHGAEILDMKNSLAADIVASGRARMLAMLAQAIDGDIDVATLSGCAGGVDAELLAGIILDALDGMKLRNLTLDDRNRLTAAYVRIVMAAIRQA